jgi:hypothetical protein
MFSILSIFPAASTTPHSIISTFRSSLPNLSPFQSSLSDEAYWIKVQ